MEFPERSEEKQRETESAGEISVVGESNNPTHDTVAGKQKVQDAHSAEKGLEEAPPAKTVKNSTNSSKNVSPNGNSEKKISVGRTINFLTSAVIFVALFRYFSSAEGAIDGLLLTLICWTAYTLSIPVNHGSVIPVPFCRLVTGKKMTYNSLYMFAAALLFNALLIRIRPVLYLDRIIPYIVYRMLKTPWPYWTIFAYNFFANFFNSWVRTSQKRSKNVWLYTLTKLSVLIATILLVTIALKEIIIIVNMKA
jgi:hypothetical protein